MTIHDFKLGESVFIFSEALMSIIYCNIGGFSEDKLRIIAFQETELGLIRHVVSWVYVFRDISSAYAARDTFMEISEVLKASAIPEEIKVGCSVHLYLYDKMVVDAEGYPALYQVITVHKNGDVSLISGYGDFAGRYSVEDVEFVSDEPIFRPGDYYVGQVVSWVDGDDVYEGVISDIRKSKAVITDIKKLMPTDHETRVEYYKLESGDHPPSKSNKNNIIKSIIGDDIDSE